MQRNVTASDWPPYSCRSGLSVPLNVSGPFGAELQPFQLTMRKKVDEVEGSMVHVLTLNKRTVKQVGLREAQGPLPHPWVKQYRCSSRRMSSLSAGLYM